MIDVTAAWLPIALMAIGTAAAVAGTVMTAMKSGGATQRGEDEGMLARLEKEYAQRSRMMANQVQAEGVRTQAVETDVTAAGVRLQTAQQEMGRRRTLAQLGAINTIDRIGRGAAYDPYDSSAAISAENQRLGEEDIGNLRLMEESGLRKLSFQKRQLELSAKGIEAGFGELPIRERDPYLDLAAEQRSGIWGQAALSAGKEIAGFGASAFKYFEDKPPPPPLVDDPSYGGAGGLGRTASGTTFG